jgi:hypothetical protein
VRQIRWALILLGVMALVGISGATVFARSSATYTNHAVSASKFTSADQPAPAQDDWYWLSSGSGQATWTFTDVYGLAHNAVSGSVNLNVNALSAGPNWGAGFGTTIKVVVTGVGTNSFTATLANPWRPHIAFNETAGIGWTATASVAVPMNIYTGASQLTVTVTALTAGYHVGFNEDALLIGYATVS